MARLTPAQRDLLKRADAARNFPDNTCPASRHVQLMADSLLKTGKYQMLADDPKHCAASMLTTVAALYEARTEIERLKALGGNDHARD